MKKVFPFALAVFLLIPSLALAAPSTFSQLVDMFLSYVNPIAGVLTSLLLLMFFWGIAKYIFSPGGEAQVQGRQMMVWGVIALFVVICFWGLVRVARSIFL